MNGFLDLHRTDERTNGRTNERDLIGPNAPRGTKNGQKWQKLAIFGQNLENENFFQKSAWNIFLALSRCSFVQKIIKIWCAVF